MLADQLHGYVTTALERQVSEFRAGGFLHAYRENLIFLLGSRAAHLEALGRISGRRFRRGNEFLGRLVGRFGVDPQHKLVERHHCHRRHVLPVKRHAGRQRCSEKVGQGDYDLVRITLGFLQREKTFRARATRFVHGDQRLLHQVMFGNDALNEARHLIGATTCTRRNHKLHGLGGFPRRSLRERGKTQNTRGNAVGNVLGKYTQPL